MHILKPEYVNPKKLKDGKMNDVYQWVVFIWAAMGLTAGVYFNSY